MSRLSALCDRNGEDLVIGDGKADQLVGFGGHHSWEVVVRSDISCLGVPEM